jgi:GntR family transcriptional regulator / MocR family aminotransferase
MFPAQLIKALRVDPAMQQPLYRQLYDAVKRAIVEGKLSPGMQLPPTREFCDLLRISRQTVLNAYELLIAEGYLTGAVGRGTYVSEHVPAIDRQARAVSAVAAPVPQRPLSARGRHFAEAGASTGAHEAAALAFRHGIPGLDVFPFETWSKLEARRWRRPSPAFGYADAAGFLPLREMIADYLHASRGVSCTPEQVVMTSGSQQSLFLISSMLLAPGDSAWMEDPGYPDARAILSAVEARVVPVPVDAEGLCVSVGTALHPDAKLVYVSPSHQYPLGGSMSLRRRLELLAWADENKAWIVEDDYDSEYRYSGPPLASLQSLDKTGCVVYVGTFSKVLFPGLRLGYMVVPTTLVDAIHRGKAVIDRHTSIAPQLVLADFIEGGHFNRHIRRTRSVYAERRAALLSALDRHFGDDIAVGPSDTGLHISFAFRRRCNDVHIAAAALREGIEVRPLSQYHAPDIQAFDSHAVASGLLLGFAPVPVAEIERSVALLRKVCGGK